jgi:hypothetical protein
VSPFGQKLTEIVIPGHLAPKNPSDEDEKATVIADESGCIMLGCGVYRYRYSRHGLEKIDEPAA